MSAAIEASDPDRLPFQLALEVITAAPTVDVVIPACNAERDLFGNVRLLHAYLMEEFPLTARITIADSASIDGTWPLAMRLANELANVRVLHLNEKGRARALAAAWLTSDARIVAYMDIDSSTDVSALLALVAPVVSGQCDVSFGNRFRDAHCGVKAMRADVARRLLPRVKNRTWFFDKELLVAAEREGLRIHELPVDEVLSHRPRAATSLFWILRGVLPMRAPSSHRPAAE
jgi:glycosyltransferase involved in cell wall biosynthesis